jgi:hypothetical protein
MTCHVEGGDFFGLACGRKANATAFQGNIGPEEHDNGFNNVKGRNYLIHPSCYSNKTFMSFAMGFLNKGKLFQL